MPETNEQRVSRLHQSVPIVDGHFDLLMYVLQKRELGYRNVIETDCLPDFAAGGVNIVVSSLFVEDAFLPEMGLRRALDQISALYAEMEESPDKIILCRTYEDIQTAQREKKLGIILSFEGIEPLGNDLNLLRIFYNLGVRIMGLVWSRRNYAADGCHFQPKIEGKKGGLTPFGVEVVQLAESLGMFLDVSHLNDEGFWDVMDITHSPVIASHSNCRSLASSMRNLTDDQIRALAKKDGVMGMNVCSMFVSDDNVTSDLDHFLNHVDHIAQLVGIQHVGLGFDFCDFMRANRPKRAVPPVRPSFDVIPGYPAIHQFTEGLVRRGYSDEDIALVLGGNFLRIYQEVFSPRL